MRFVLSKACGLPKTILASSSKGAATLSPDQHFGPFWENSSVCPNTPASPRKRLPDILKRTQCVCITCCTGDGQPVNATWKCNCAEAAVGERERERNPGGLLCGGVSRAHARNDREARALRKAYLYLVGLASLYALLKRVSKHLG